MSLRKTGIDIIGDVPWGIHLCQFYQTKEDLTDILIPYFKTGLENNEFCLWVTSDLLDEQEALQVMREAVPDFGQYLEKGQIGIVPHTEWYLKYKSFSPQMILNGGLKEIDQVLANGYDGIRVAGNAAWLAKKDCKSLNDHQKVADNARGQYPIMVICAYPLDKCGASEAIDVVKNHHLSLIKQGDQWQVVGSSAHERIDRAPPGSEQEYRHLFESTLDGMEVIDAETGKIALANQAVARMFGFDSPEQLIGLNPLEYIPVEDRERVAGMMAEHMFGKDLHQVMELRALTKDGREIWISAIGVRTEYQGRLAGIVSMNDVTGRKQAEEALQESERRYRLLAENSSDVIWTMDMELRPTYVSPSITHMLGHSVDEAMARKVEQSLTPASLEIALKALSEGLSIADTNTEDLCRSRTMELEMIRKNGSTIWTEVEASFLRNSDGQPSGIMVMARDITERKQAEEQLHQSFYNLEKTLEGTIQAITLMVETRDRYTAGHQQRVTELACTIAREMGLSSKQIQTIRIAGLLHDLGKIFIPTEILSKPGRLTDIELAIIKTHPKAGYDILKNIDFPWPIADIVVQHHERMNGSGYPSGLQGEEITLEARILAVSDIIEAMASHRPYRPSLGLDRALKEVIDNKGVLYDSDVVDACLKVFVEKRFKLGEELATSSVG